MPASQHPDLYLGIDVGTTGAKAIVVDGAGRPHGRGRASYDIDSPRPGHYIQDAKEWQSAAVTVVRMACGEIAAERVVALAISAQGGTLVALDGGHEPLGPARSWLDRRATRSAATFEQVFGREDFYRRTGWPIGPNNTAAQLLDLASSDPRQFVAARCFCDTAAFLNGWLTGTPTVDTNVVGISQLTDASSGRWDDDILSVIGIASDRLPSIAASGTPIGPLSEAAASAFGLRPGIVVGAGAQDQYCAALGAGAVRDRDVLLSTGTAWVMLAVAPGPYTDPAGGIGSGRHLVPRRWGHFGEVTNGGASIEWARSLLNHGDNPPLPVDDLDALLAETPRGASGLSFFPHFDGTSPYDIRGTSCGSLLGLSLSHDHRHVLRAVAEGVALAMRALLEGYRSAIGSAAATPVVVGGATRSPEWMQLLADILCTDLLVSKEPEAACLGAAILAAAATGDIPDICAGVDRMASCRTTLCFDPAASQLYERQYTTYQRDGRTLSALYAARPQPLARRELA